MLSSVLSYFTSCFKFSGQVLLYCPFPVLDSQPTATKLFQSPLYGSGTVFCSILHLLRHFPSSGVTLRHTFRTLAATRNYCCRVREMTLTFMDTLIALTYLLTYLNEGVGISRNDKMRTRIVWDALRDSAVLQSHGNNKVALSRFFFGLCGRRQFGSIRSHVNSMSDRIVSHL